MKLTVCNAISIDGYIATLDDDTSWVNDWEEFSAKVKSTRAIIMGRKTYECSGQDFPYDCELNVVMTGDQELIRGMQGQANCWFTDASPEEVLREIEDRGFEEVLLIGGGRLNGAFLKAGLIDEVIVDIHPLILSQGIKMFETETQANLVQISSTELDSGLVQIHFSVQK